MVTYDFIESYTKPKAAIVITDTGPLFIVVAVASSPHQLQVPFLFFFFIKKRNICINSQITGFLKRIELLHLCNKAITATNY